MSIKEKEDRENDSEASRKQHVEGKVCTVYACVGAFQMHNHLFKAGIKP